MCVHYFYANSHMRLHVHASVADVLNYFQRLPNEIVESPSDIIAFGVRALVVPL